MGTSKDPVPKTGPMQSRGPTPLTHLIDFSTFSSLVDWTYAEEVLRASPLLPFRRGEAEGERLKEEKGEPLEEGDKREENDKERAYCL